MNNVAIIVGAGSGTRMKSEKSKLLLELDGKTVIKRTVEAFCRVEGIDSIIVVCRKEDKEAFTQEVGAVNGISFVFGGATRQQSVQNAVNSIDGADLIIIHDGARPLIKSETIEAAINEAKQCGAAAVGVPVKDTIKVVDSKGIIKATPDRSSLFAVQTPQIFDFKTYKAALNAAQRDGMDFTDDCQIIEYSGGKVKMVTGEYSNIKVTTPEDIILAESLLKEV